MLYNDPFTTAVHGINTQTSRVILSFKCNAEGGYIDFEGEHLTDDIRTVTNETNIIITAVPLAGYKLEYWTNNGVIILTNPLEITTNYEDINIVARFTKYYTVTIKQSGLGIITGLDYYDTTTDNSYEYFENTDMIITAIPDDIYNFTKWIIDNKTMYFNPVLKKRITEDFDIHLLFERKYYKVKKTIYGKGSIEITPRVFQTSYHNDELTVTAVPDDGWTFSHWEGDFAYEVEDNFTYTTIGPVNIVVVFTNT